MTKQLDENMSKHDPVPDQKSGMDDPAVRQLLARFSAVLHGVPSTRRVAIKRHVEPDDSPESLERRRQALIDEEARRNML